MQKVLIVEDDYNQLNELKTSIQKNYPNWNIQTADNSKQARFLLDVSLQPGQTFTLFLLDVQLEPETGKTGGFLLAEEIRKHPEYFTTPLLFLTSVSDENYFALSHYHCYNYIAKPYQMKDIIEQLQQMILTGFLMETTFFVRDESHITHTIALQDILYAQSSSHTISLTTRQTVISTRAYTMDGLLKELGRNFCRCHKKYIINLSHIENYDKTARYLTIRKNKIPVGRTYKNTLEKALCVFSGRGGTT